MATAFNKGQNNRIDPLHLPPTLMKRAVVKGYHWLIAVRSALWMHFSLVYIKDDVMCNTSYWALCAITRVCFQMNQKKFLKAQRVHYNGLHLCFKSSPNKINDESFLPHVRISHQIKESIRLHRLGFLSNDLKLIQKHFTWHNA